MFTDSRNGLPSRSRGISSQTFSSLRQTGKNPSSTFASRVTSANGLGAAASGRAPAAAGPDAPGAGAAADAAGGALGVVAGGAGRLAQPVSSPAAAAAIIEQRKRGWSMRVPTGNAGPARRRLRRPAGPRKNARLCGRSRRPSMARPALRPAPRWHRPPPANRQALAVFHAMGRIKPRSWPWRRCKSSRYLSVSLRFAPGHEARSIGFTSA